MLATSANDAAAAVAAANHTPLIDDGIQFLTSFNELSIRNVNSNIFIRVSIITILSLTFISSISNFRSIFPM